MSHPNNELLYNHKNDMVSLRTKKKTSPDKCLPTGSIREINIKLWINVCCRTQSYNCTLIVPH